jgi:branched-chain amino acid aminotransferase
MDIPVTNVAKSHIMDVDFNNLPFGKVMSVHMAIAEYAGGVWQNARVVPYGPLSLPPSIVALHYGQTVFEGMKVFRGADGVVRFFRVDMHAKRLNTSLKRLGMAELPEELFMSMLHAFVRTDAAWVSNVAGTSFYVRPFVFATDPQVKMHASEEYTFIIFGCPSGPYYDKPIKLKVEQTYSRAAPGGAGSTKAGGNYGASLYPTILANREGFDQLLWTDAATHALVEESGTMNIMFVIDSELITPPLGDTILPGITRDSLLTIARDMGIRVVERPISVDELFAAHAKGKLTEAFGTGTAVVVSPFASITRADSTINMAPPNDQSIGTRLQTSLTNIRHGRVSDTHGWVDAL